MEMMQINESKNILRASMQEKTAKLSEGEKAEKSFNACMNVLNSIEFKNAKTVMVYKAMKNECDPSLIAYTAYELKKKVVYPLCNENGSLKPLAPKTHNDFVKGKYGIWEPDEENSDEIDCNEIDLIIVPGLAFDKNRSRLGRGGGYYDRFLPKCKNACKIGFCFNEQLIDYVPFADTDVKMNKIVTNI